MKLRRLAVSLLLLCLLAFPGCSEKSNTIVLKFAHGLDLKHPVHKSLEFMARRLEDKSDGRVTMEIFPSEQLGNERESIELVQLGIIDLTKTSTSPLESFIPEMAVFSIPYIFRDNDHFWRVLKGPVGRQLQEAGRHVRLQGLCYYDSGSRSFYTQEKAILTPADLVGLKIRVQQSATSMEMVQALGGSPTPIPWGELYTALQQGVVDGAENNPPSFDTSRHYEVCKHYSLDEHTRVPDIILINSERWDEFSPEIQQIIQEAADESAVYQRKLWEEKTQQSLETVQAAGVKIYYPDKQPFIDAVQEMHRSYEGTRVGEMLEQIKQTE